MPLPRILDYLRGRALPDRSQRPQGAHPDQAAPFMTPEEICWVEGALLALPHETEVHVFEYGAGHSTVHFSRLLGRHGYAYRWIAVEHVRSWAERVRQLVAEAGLESVEILYRPVGDLDGRMLNRSRFRKELLATARPIAYESYTGAIGESGDRFDLVIVDGRNRKQSVRTALGHLRPGGRVLLHDATREYYRCLIDALSDGSFLCDRLWTITAASAEPPG